MLLAREDVNQCRLIMKALKCSVYIMYCSLKPYNIKGKSYTINTVDRTAVLLSVMITHTISGFALKWKM